MTDTKLLRISSVHHNRSMRQLNRNFNRTKKLEKPGDIVSEFLDHGSDLYAPQMRFGNHPRSFHFTKHKTNFIAPLEQLQTADAKGRKLKSFLELKPKLEEPKKTTIEISRRFGEERNLQQLYDSLKALRLQSNVHKEIAKCMKTIKRNSSSLARDISSPKLVSYNSPKKEKSPATSNIQRRGDRLEYINSQKTLLASLLKAECKIQDVLNEIEEPAYILEYLDKQMEKLHDERKSHAVFLLAEKERHRREMTDAHQKTIDVIRLKEQKELYQCIMNAHNDSSIFYLENVLVQCYKNIAECDARDRIRSTARKIDSEALPSPSSFENCVADEENEAEFAVSDIMDSFLWPNILKRIDSHVKRTHILLDLKNPSGLNESGQHSASPGTEDYMHSYIPGDDSSDISTSKLSYYNSAKELASSPAISSTGRIVYSAFENTLHKTSKEVLDSQEKESSDLLMEIVSDIRGKVQHVIENDELEKSADKRDGEQDE